MTNNIDTDLCISELFSKLNIFPQFTKNNIPIVFSSSNLYARYVSVSIISLLENSDSSYNYDINILETDLSEEIKNRLKSIEMDYSNVAIRFINLQDILEHLFCHFYLRGQVTKESYYRFFIGEILKNYEKVIYLDADTVVKGNIVELYNQKVDANLLAAVNDVSILLGAITKYKRADIPYTYDIYFTDVLKILPNSYIQAGVMLMNTKKMYQDNFAQKCMDKLYEIGKPLWVDQDIINIVANKKIKYIDIKWNYGLHIKETEDFASIPNQLYKNVVNQRNDIKILHMTGPKCDTYPHNEFSDIFWKYARLSPFYEILLFDNILRMPARWNNELANIHFPNINNHFAKNEKDMKLLFVMAHPVKFRLKKWCYGIKKAFAFGKRHKKYQNKFNAVKQLIKEAKIYEKQLAGI